MRSRVDSRVAELAEANVLPNVTKYVEDLCLQETNRWGEATGKPVTFIEYLVARAEAYLREEVNFEGKTRAEAHGYSWQKAQTRITHLVHQHLQYSIDSAMKDAISTANSALTDGIAETCRIKLREIAKNLKVNVKVK